MSQRIGDKGEIVISAAIRAQLGLRPGWLVEQRIVGDHVELRFAAPATKASQAGRLRRYAAHPAPFDVHDGGDPAIARAMGVMAWEAELPFLTNPERTDK